MANFSDDRYRCALCARVGAKDDLCWPVKNRTGSFLYPTLLYSLAFLAIYTSL